MTDARQAFHDLHDAAGQAYDTTELSAGTDRVGRRVARHRAGQRALASVAGLALAGIVALGATHLGGDGDLAPATSPSPPPSASQGPPGVIAGPTDESASADSLLRDPEALAVHAEEGITQDRLPHGFTSDGYFEEESGLIPVRMYTDGSGTIVTIRLVPAVDFDAYIFAGWVDLDEAAVFTDADRTVGDPEAEQMRLTIPIGDSAVLVVDGEGVTDAALLRAFVDALLS